MSNSGKLLYIKHFTTWVGNSFTKHALCVRTESLLQFLFTGILIHKCHVYAQLLHSYAEQVVGSSIDGGRAHKVVACLTHIEYRIEIGCLSRRSEHCCDTAFKSGYLSGNSIIGRILQTGVEISTVLKVEKTSHLITVIIFKCCALINRQHARFAFLWGPTLLHT